MADPGIVRNRAKINATIGNARAWLVLDDPVEYLWSFVDGRPVQGTHRAMGELPAHTEASDRMSKELKRRGFRFVGGTICYSLMQACGMVNDHLVGCFRHREVGRATVTVWAVPSPSSSSCCCSRSLILMAGAVGAAIFGNLLTADAEARNEGSELLDLTTLSRRPGACHPVPRAPAGHQQRGPDPGRHPLRGRTDAAGPAAARPPTDGGRAAGDGGAHGHAGGHRRAGGAADLQRGAGAGVHLDRPPPVPLLRAVGTDRGGHAVRPRRRRRGHVRRHVAGVVRAVFAENEALRWLADLAGLPASAGGVFVSGGSAANLSALVVARQVWRSAGPSDRDAVRPLIVASTGAHSSVRSAARVMDADVSSRSRPTTAAGRPATRSRPGWTRSTDADRDRVAAIVATAGTTNLGVVDDLAGIGAAGPRARPSGSTSTPRTAVPRWPCRAPGPSSTGSSRPTASSSTRTSGCSRRSTARRSCTASRPWRGPPTPSTPSTWTS